MIARDPRIYPQAGDEVRVDDLIRNVIAHDGERVFVRGPGLNIGCALDTGQKWCEKSSAVASKAIG
jgi:hypothetical protein